MWNIAQFGLHPVFPVIQTCAVWFSAGYYLVLTYLGILWVVCASRTGHKFQRRPAGRSSVCRRTAQARRPCTCSDSRPWESGVWLGNGPAPPRHSKQLEAVLSEPQQSCQCSVVLWRLTLKWPSKKYNFGIQPSCLPSENVYLHEYRVVVDHDHSLVLQPATMHESVPLSVAVLLTLLTDIPQSLIQFL